MSFQKAERRQRLARIAIAAPTGGGKTWTALAIATGLCPEGKSIGLIDTENRSASLYAGQFDFMTCDLFRFSPNDYIKAIHDAEEAGFGVLIIDSGSHAWMGKGGVLDMKDEATKRSKSGNSFTAWRDVTPEHNNLVEALVRCRCHLIVTLRSKMEYVLQEDDRGRKMPTKLGMAPMQRDGFEYEFDVVADMDLDHNLVVTKTRLPFLDRRVIKMPGKEIGREIRAWLETGAEALPAPPADPPAPDPAPAAEPSRNGKASGKGGSNEAGKIRRQLFAALDRDFEPGPWKANAGKRKAIKALCGAATDEALWETCKAGFGRQQYADAVAQAKAELADQERGAGEPQTDDDAAADAAERAAMRGE